MKAQYLPEGVEMMHHFLEECENRKLFRHLLDALPQYLEGTILASEFVKKIWQNYQDSYYQLTGGTHAHLLDAEIAWLEQIYKDVEDQFSEVQKYRKDYSPPWPPLPPRVRKSRFRIVRWLFGTHLHQN